MNKQDRQNALTELIASQTVGSQSELASLLCELGYNVTQASVSRDLDDLGIVKLDGRYVMQGRPRGESEFGPVSLETAGDCIIVGRCKSGLASAITVRIDASRIPEIVGTIAGDDTIFIAVKDAKGQSAAINVIRSMFS